MFVFLRRKNLLKHFQKIKNGQLCFTWKFMFNWHKEGKWSQKLQSIHSICFVQFQRPIHPFSNPLNPNRHHRVCGRDFKKNQISVWALFKSFSKSQRLAYKSTTPFSVQRKVHELAVPSPMLSTAPRKRLTSHSDIFSTDGGGGGACWHPRCSAGRNG